jgi:acyl carrier protein
MSTALTGDIKAILADALGIGTRIDAFNDSTRLLGEIPEMDSMAVVAVITALEERFDFVVYDDEISAATFETLATLTAFVAQKLENK